MPGEVAAEQRPVGFDEAEDPGHRHAGLENGAHDVDLFLEHSVDELGAVAWADHQPLDLWPEERGGLTVTVGEAGNHRLVLVPRTGSAWALPTAGQGVLSVSFTVPLLVEPVWRWAYLGVVLQEIAACLRTGIGHSEAAQHVATGAGMEPVRLVAALTV